MRPINFVQSSIVALLILFFSQSAFAEKPNILFIYLDDFGWRDTGFMGSDFYETPTLDALSKKAMVFTDAYSCAANCAPARLPAFRPIHAAAQTI